MPFALGAGASAAGYRLAAYDALGSTNEEALALGRAGDPGRLWVVAGRQTAGRGRRGRPWESPAGNLAATLLLSLPADAARSGTLGFVAGVALHEALSGVAPGLQPKLKWPNDVLLGRAKLAGILLEAAQIDGRHLVAVGIGVNVAQAPELGAYPTASLASAGASATAEQLFAALADAWATCEVVWDEGRGFAAIRDQWLARAAGIGGIITVRQGGSELTGTFDTLDEAGRLVLRSGEGTAHLIMAGDVYFGTAASAGAGA